MLSLKFSASKASWQVPPNHGTAKEEKILHGILSKKFSNRCQYCNTYDTEYNEISHIDENHSNNNEDNLTLACPLCHQCLHLGRVAGSEGGKMIWAPDISQAEINNLARTYWIMEFDQDHPMLHSTRALANRIDHQANVLESYYVSGASNPGFWAEMLIKLTPEQYERRGELMSSIRLWPSLTKFKKMIPKWATAIEVNLPKSEWERLAVDSINKTEIDLGKND